MNSYYISVITFMRMCIVLRRFSMSCPSGMSDTTSSFYSFSIISLLC